ncbi:DUF397 domain-containing protein [Streptomyces sp. NPDC020719]|uniref:DUF397 domain-containing protein n=1 Tax=unclassified Streptomyces TaxID=2593676 RepID=UPI0033C11949
MHPQRPADPHWFKSSYSSDSGNACLEVADLGPTVGIRDSKDLRIPAVAVPKRAWAAFVRNIRCP